MPRFAPKGDYTIDGAVLLDTLLSTTPPPDALDSDDEGSTGTLDGKPIIYWLLCKGSSLVNR